ncbi:aspartate kinase, monofunctional class [archaeon SCG-AAA382B04]|nr:aspartate kinase, monofunctional class [archaeon SCG-AAA382B04]
MQEKIVMKFGGTSIESEDLIERVVSIIKEKYERDIGLVVVVSAFSGTTDNLIEISDFVRDNKRKKAIELVEEVEKRYIEVAKNVIKKENIREEVFDELDSRINELKTFVKNVDSVKERELDFFMSFGERLSAPIISGALCDEGVSSSPLTGKEAGVLTNDIYGDARPLDESEKKIRETLSPLIEEEVPIVTGFIGSSKEGDITTLGRGGSDYTASIIGEAIKADEIWIWTDVSGVLTCDPSIMSNAKPLKSISYREALELSYFGADVLHPKSIEPAIENNIPVIVKNTYNPSAEGTKIVKEEEKIKGVVKGISIEDNVALLNVSGIGMLGKPGVAANILDYLANENINVKMISTGSCEPTISILIDERELEKANDLLKKDLGASVIEEVCYEKDVAAISVVGAGMAGTPGVAGRVFSTMGNSEVNIKMISQGSSEFNISFVIKEKDVEESVKALHSEFGLENI